MVLDAMNSMPWTKEELVSRFPFLLSGAEGEGEGGEGGTPGAGGDGPGATTTPPPSDGGEGEPKTYDEAYVKSLRDENASRRVKEKEALDRIAEYEKAEEERKKAEMSEAERAKAEAEEAKTVAAQAQQQLVDERKRNAVISEAAKLKFLDPEDALAYIELEAITMTEEGRPHKTSVEAAVKKVAETKKYLIEGTGSADGGSRGDNPKTEAERLKQIQDDITARGGVPVPS